VHNQTPSIAASKVARSRPPSASPNSLDYTFEGYLQTYSIVASKLAQSLPPIASRNLLERGLQVNLQTRSITASKVAQSGLPIASPNSHDRGLQVHLQTPSITACKYISKLARSRPRSASLSSLDHGVVERWSWNANSPSSTLRRTSHGIRREFVRKNRSGSNSVGSG
jgi:hypothetical protein